MSSINDGGPAFPEIRINAEFSPGGEFHLRSTPIAVQGMSLRDYFAANAPPMPGCWVGYQREDCDDLPANDQTELSLLVSWRWWYADAMLTARTTPPEPRP